MQHKYVTQRKIKKHDYYQLFTKKSNTINLQLQQEDLLSDNIEETHIIYTDYNQRKQWILTIDDFSILCLWQPLENKEQILPQDLGENYKINNTTKIQNSDQNLKFDIKQDEGKNLQALVGQNEKDKIEAQIFNLDKQKVQFESYNVKKLIQDLNCHQISQNKDIVYQSNCVKNETKQQILEQEIEEQMNNLEKYLREKYNKTNEDSKRSLISQNTFSDYGNWCGPDRGGYSDQNCKDICYNQGIEECVKCLPYIDPTDKACVYHDECAVQDELKAQLKGQKLLCDDELQRYSCECSKQFLEDNWEAYWNGCDGYSWKCELHAAKNYAGFRVLPCGCEYSRIEYIRDSSSIYNYLFGDKIPVQIKVRECTSYLNCDI